ncbi:hypothetical protein ACFWSF_17570 [Streptomyces sp. NPDC058611]|uniref:hypothetical protein n=1 Tax=unclassified Streptomyces TaxID=2593676 RepID=UPI003655C2C8
MLEDGDLELVGVQRDVLLQVHAVGIRQGAAQVGVLPLPLRQIGLRRPLARAGGARRHQDGPAVAGAVVVLLLELFQDGTL